MLGMFSVKWPKTMIALTISYLILLMYLTYLLFQARTPTTTPIWTAFDPANLLLYLGMTFILLITMALKGNSKLKLSLIIVHSVVSHIFLVVIYEGRYGFDTWIGAWVSKGISSGEVFPYNVFSNLPPISKAFHIIQGKFSPSVSAVLARMFSVDVYWIQHLLVPIVWGVFVPIMAYEVSKSICKSQVTSLLSALLTLSVPYLIIWGAITVRNSFGWIFFFLTVYFSLKYISSKVNVFFVALSAFFSLIAHVLTGTVSVCLFVLAYFYKKYASAGNPKATKKLIFSLVYVLCILILPLSLYARRWTTYPPVGGTFSLEPLRSLAAYDAILLIIFGNYVNLNFGDLFVNLIVPLLGLLGMILVVASRGEKYDKNLCRFLLLFSIVIIIDYRIIKCFMVNVAFGAERMWVFRDLLLIPFAPFVLMEVLNFLSRRDVERIASRFHPNRDEFREVASRAVVFLAVSALITSSIYLGYPRGEIVWVTGYELEAVRYIEATTQERYVVICHKRTSWAGSAVVGRAGGSSNPRAYYEGAGYLNDLYNEMVEKPSLEYAFAAREINDASVVYVVLQESRLGTGANATIEMIMDLPYVESYGIFGDVHVFRIKLPSKRVISGAGPSVYLYNLNTYVNTTFTLDVATYEAEYTLLLNHSREYKINGWPDHWSFERIAPDPTTRHVDANAWINFTGSEDVEYSVTWTANILYQPVGWKDDSFEEGWNVKLSRWTEEGYPEVSKDGDILTLEGFFEEEAREIYWLVKDVKNVSTNDYPYVLIRWMSTSTCTIAWVYYSDGTGQGILLYGSYTPAWTVSVMKLPEEKTVETLMIGIDDHRHDTSGVQHVEFDFVILANVTKPSGEMFVP